MENPLPLSIGVLRHIGYKKDPRTGAWLKVAQTKPHDNDDEDVEEGDPVPPPAQAPPQDAQFFVKTSAILEVIGSLRDVASGINARMSTMEEHIDNLMSLFPPPQPP